MGQNKLKAKKQDKNLQRKALMNDLIPLVKSFGLWIVLVVIVAWDYTSNRWFSMLFIDFTTYISYGIAKILGLQAMILGSGTSTITTLEVHYTSVTINNFPMIIELECSAYHAYIAMVALIVFSSWKIKQKFIMGSIIFSTLAVINSLRIVILGVIGRKFPGAFNLMHDYIWNILLVIVIWGIWEIANRKMKVES